MSVQSQIDRIKGNVDKALAKIAEKGVAVSANANSNNLEELIDAIGIGVVPSYWKSYLATKATEINTALNAAGENRSAFLWYTDAHWTSNYGKSPMILKYLSKNTGIQKTFFGGDIAVEKTGEISTLTAWKEMVKDIPDHHSIIGNHDNQVTDLADAPAADFFIQFNRTGDMAIGTHATNGKMYYYIDNHIEKTRYICLSTGRMWTNSDEVEWCIDVLNSTPKNWHIVVLSHLWLNNDYTNGGVITTPVEYTQGYLDMFDAYNYRQNGTESCTGKAYDFANAQGKIEFIMGGHVHLDYDFTTATDIPVILTECDAGDARDSVTYAKQGTTTENCVYAVVADYAAKSVKVINVGRGDTRTLTIPDVVTYTNWAKKAYAGADLSIYNGKGYKENTRLSSGNEAAETGWCVTGFIPAKRSSVLRFRNCVFYNMSGNKSNRTHFEYFGADFAYLNQSSYPTPTSPLSPTTWGAKHDTDGNLIECKMPTSIPSSTKYVRITMDDINSNSIITVDEEID
jgi:hypothetical protein